MSITPYDVLVTVVITALLCCLDFLGIRISIFLLIASIVLGVFFVRSYSVVYRLGRKRFECDIEKAKITEAVKILQQQKIQKVSSKLNAKKEVEEGEIVDFIDPDKITVSMRDFD